MLDVLKQAEANEDEYRRRAIAARKDAEENVRTEIGLSCAVSVHVGKLYGSVGSIHCKAPRYSSIDKFPAPSIEDIEKLLAYLPPIALQDRKSACRSIRPQSWNAKDDSATDTVRQLAPIIIRIKPGDYPELTMEWWGSRDNETWRVSVELPWGLIYQQAFGSLRIASRDIGFGRGVVYDSCEFRAVTPLSVIRWASGGNQYPNEFTLTGPIDFDMWALIRAALEKNTARQIGDR